MYVYVYIYTYMNIYLEYLETAYASVIRRERVHITIIYRDHKVYIKSEYKNIQNTYISLYMYLCLYLSLYI